jgi:hypothetical protein
MWPFAVAVDGGKYFLTAFTVRPGNDRNWSLFTALHHELIVGEKQA